MPYETLEYLLDRANIEDVVRKIGAYLDEQHFDRLATEVYAKELWFDYSKLMGTPATKMSGQALADQWKGLSGSLNGTHHQVGGIVSELPQPGGPVDPPVTVAVFTNFAVTLRKDGGPGENYLRTIGRLRYEVTRTEETGNPWRVSSLVISPIHQTGDLNLMSG